MKFPLCVIAALLVLSACGRGAERLQTEIAGQEKKIVAARTVFELEQKRMAELRDSLEINIRRNIELRMDTTTAAAIEKERLELQRTIVEAAKRNLRSQEEFLALLKKRLQAPR